MYICECDAPFFVQKYSSCKGESKSELKKEKFPLHFSREGTKLLKSYFSNQHFYCPRGEHLLLIQSVVAKK